MSIAEKLQTIAENEQRVYDAGYAKGQAEGGDTSTAYAEGFAAGKKAEYDAFWDAYQENGNRTNYSLAFGGTGWAAEGLLKPKYPVRPVKAYRMFETSTLTDLTIIDVDFSQCTSFTQCFASSSFRKIGIIDTRSASSLEYMLSGPTALVSVEKVIFRDDGSQKIDNTTFLGLLSLESITFEGVIGTGNLSMPNSTKLSKASITSIINALSTTTSGLTVTLSKTAKEAAFTADEWAALIATRTNWTISLV